MPETQESGFALPSPFRTLKSAGDDEIVRLSLAEQMDTVTRRYAPQLPFPEYAFVPGKHPHPATDPDGHLYGETPAPVPSIDPANPIESMTFLFGIDLFNAGYYWEAHEAWEQLWVAAGRTGELADFLKGLIKLAAAGVKSREGQRSGVERHARRALQLFQQLRDRHPEPQFQFCAISIDQMTQRTKELINDPTIDETTTIKGSPVLGFRLELDVPADSGQVKSAGT